MTISGEADEIVDIYCQCGDSLAFCARRNPPCPVSLVSVMPNIRRSR